MGISKTLLILLAAFSFFHLAEGDYYSDDSYEDGKTFYDYASKWYDDDDDTGNAGEGSGLYQPESTAEHPPLKEALVLIHLIATIVENADEAEGSGSGHDTKNNDLKDTLHFINMLTGNAMGDDRNGFDDLGSVIGDIGHGFDVLENAIDDIGNHVKYDITD